MLEPTTSDPIEEAAAFLLELVDVDLLPAELTHEARRLSVALQVIAQGSEFN